MKDKKPTGMELIKAERRRQIVEEGYSSAHDDAHDTGALLHAAHCYVYAASLPVSPKPNPPPDWPWDDKDWKPSQDPIRNLQKAGALIQAEIDRLIRWQDTIAERLDRGMASVRPCCGRPDDKCDCEPKSPNGLVI